MGCGLKWVDCTRLTPFGVEVGGWMGVRRLKPTATHGVPLRRADAMANGDARPARRIPIQRRSANALPPIDNKPENPVTGKVVDFFTPRVPTPRTAECKVAAGVGALDHKSRCGPAQDQTYDP